MLRKTFAVLAGGIQWLIVQQHPPSTQRLSLTACILQHPQSHPAPHFLLVCVGMRVRMCFMSVGERERNGGGRGRGGGWGGKRFSAVQLHKARGFKGILGP